LNKTKPRKTYWGGVERIMEPDLTIQMKNTISKVLHFRNIYLK
jgi:hypothetical protein